MQIEDRDDEKRRKGLKKNVFLVNKHELPIGQDLQDEKLLTACGEFYANYDLCLQQTQGDFGACRLYRKALKNCEVLKGFFQANQQAMLRRH